MDSLLRLKQRALNEQPARQRSNYVPPLKNIVRNKKLVALRNRYDSHPFYSSRAWLKLRYSVLRQRGRRCEACKIEGLNIRFHVDHVRPRSLFPSLALEASNLQVLCEACNLGKSNVDQTDWRTTGKKTK